LMNRRPGFPRLFEETLNTRQYFRTFRCDGNGVFEMCRRATVESHDSPSVFENANLFCSEVDHRLDRDHQTRFYFRTLCALHVVQHRWILMQRSADPMATEFADNAEMMFIREFLHRCRNIGDEISRHRRLDGLVQTLFGDMQKVLNFGRNLANGDRHRRISEESVDDHTEIQTDHIPLFENALVRWNPVNNLFVN